MMCYVLLMFKYNNNVLHILTCPSLEDQAIYFFSRSLELATWL